MKIDITIPRRRKPQSRSNQPPRRGIIESQAGVNRVGRRRLQKGGIRMFDLGVYLDNEEWVTLDYIAGQNPNSLLETLHTIPFEEWPTYYKTIDEERDELIYKLNLTAASKTVLGETIPLGSWQEDRYKFSEEGWLALTNQESANYSYDSMLDASGSLLHVEGVMADEDPVLVTEGQFGALIECNLTKYNNSAGIEEGYKITNSTTPPSEHEAGLTIVFEKEADWYFVPKICQSVAMVRPLNSYGGEERLVNYTRINEGLPGQFYLWANHLSVLERVEGKTIRGYWHTREDELNVPASAIPLFERLLDLEPLTACNYDGDPETVPSLSDFVFNQHVTSALQDESPPVDIFKISEERRPEMIIHQGEEWFYLWDTSKWYEPNEPHGNMPISCAQRDNVGPCRCYIPELEFCP